MNLLLVGIDGKVVACSQADKFGNLAGADLSGANWVRRAMLTQSGDQYIVDDIFRDNLHNNKMVAVYATAVRRKGNVDGQPVGVLGVFFDWEEQSRIIVENEPSLSQEEWQRSRVLLLDNNKRIIAASDNNDLFSIFPLVHQQQQKGYYILENGDVVAFAKTIGYQEYDGLGWYAVIIQKAKK